MNKVSLDDVLQLSVSERIQLVEDIWDSIATAAQPTPLSETQRAELDRRLQNHRDNPTSGTPWPQVRQEILDAQ